MNRLVRLRGAIAAGMLVAIGATAGPVGAQQASGVGTVEGLVRESGTGRPVEGAQVGITGTGLGALTNSSGVYRIVNVPARAVELRVRQVGFSPASKSVTVTAGETTKADFDLAQSALQLETVVTTGTGGATEVRKLGNTVATVEPPKFAPINTPSELIQGREPGVVGLSSSGLAGEGMRIRIRGNASLTQSNEPIIFVDGMRINSNGSQSGGSSISRLDDIDPNIIDHVEILKGAAAATLYGTEASNGVIQIFTKRGAAGTPKWDFTAQQEASSYPKGRLEDNWGYATRQGQADSLSKFWGKTITPYVPFSEPLLKNYFETGKTTTLSGSVTGGTQNLNYFVAGRYNKDDGPFAPQRFPGSLVNDYVRRGSGSVNLSVFPFSTLKLGARAQYVNQFADRPQYGNNIYSPVTLLEFGKPELANCYNSDPARTDPDLGIKSVGVCKFGGNEVGSPGAFGTPEETSKKLSTIGADRFLSAIDLAYNPFTQLNFTGTVGVDYTSETTVNFQPFGYNTDGVIGDNVFGQKGIYQWNDRELTLDFKGNWTRDFGSRINSAFVAGVQGFLSKQTFPGSNGYDFPGPGIAITQATGTQYANDAVNETVNGGYFAQEQVGLNNWIFLTGGARYDYSSAFGKSSAGVVYPKASISIVPTDLPGWKSDLVSSLRLRAAWGKSGRQPAAYAKFTTFAAQGGPSGAGLKPDNIGNSDLKPEVSTEIEGGAEIGFLNDRYGIQGTYWKRRVDDLLFAVQFPPSGGFTNAQLTNIGVMDAHGIELSSKAFVVQRPGMSLDLFANISFLKQKIVSLGGAPELKVDAAYARIRNYIKPGYAPGEIFGARVMQPCGGGKSTGCLQAGQLPYDLNKDGAPDTEAQVLAFLSSPHPYTDLFNGQVILLENGLNSDLGKPTPDYTGGFGGNLNVFKNWRVSTLFEYKGGNYKYWCLICGFRNASPRGNNSSLAAKVQSTLENPSATAEQRLAAAKDWVYKLASLTPYQGLNEVSDGDFLRWRELSLTYTAPRALSSRIGGRDVAITLTGRNLMLWTKYQGVDPEVAYTGRSAFTNTTNGVDANFEESIDGFGLPVPRRYGLSIRIGF